MLIMPVPIFTRCSALFLLTFFFLPITKSEEGYINRTPMSRPSCLTAKKTDMTAVRSEADVTRAISANRAELTPAPRPSAHTHARRQNMLMRMKIAYSLASQTHSNSYMYNVIQSVKHCINK